MRSVSGIAAESAFSSVVLPEPVPPEIRMFSSAWTQRSRNSTASAAERAELDRGRRACSRSCVNLRIVISGPVSESGGMIELTRLPSGRRASTIGDDSSMRRPTSATILLMIRRRCDSSLKRDVRLVEAALALDPDVVRAVDHDLGHAVVGEQPLERAVAEDVVGDLGGEPLAVVARDARLLRELAPRVGEHPLAQRRRVEVGVEQLRPEVADDREVDAVLDLGERVVAARRASRGPGGCQTLVQIHG